MYTLGLTGGMDAIDGAVFNFDSDVLHDSAAVLLRGHEVIAGIEEERLSRIKHTNKFAASAIAFCLERAGIDLNDIDRIAIYFSEAYLERAQKHLRLTRPELNLAAEPREFYRELFRREFGRNLPPEKFRFIHHHVAHAASAYYMSGFEAGLILTIDGTGDDVSTMVMDAHGKTFDTLLEKPTAESLGTFYQEVIRFLGYRAFDEYKVMGLAPYGRGERYRSLFRSFYTLLPDGNYTLHRNNIYKLYEVLAPRKRGEPFTQVHMDIAAALQDALEDLVFHILGHFQKATGRDSLAIAGGVGQNSSLNGKILQSGLFRRVFAPSFAGDSGCALGAALQAAHEARPELPLSPVNHAYWGTRLPERDKLEKNLLAWSDFIHIEYLGDTAEPVADLIAAGAVVGWVQGCSEFGPRALGNRSIIADPRVASHKDTINAMIKKRESYRPFAPSVLEEYVGEFFEIPGEGASFPFMAFVVPVKSDNRDLLPAITHVDGTARLQTVSRSDNEKYWRLIDAFRRKTGIPMLLNTSFNNNAEPIVDSVDDAIVCYLTSGLDYLVVGDFLARKKTLSEIQLKTLKPVLAAPANAIREYSARQTFYYLTWNYDTSSRRLLPKAWHDILCQADGATSLETLIQRLGISGDEETQVMQLLPDLWSDRWIVFHPVRAGCGRPSADCREGCASPGLEEMAA
jgi:carbamoyltransferase